VICPTAQAEILQGRGLDSPNRLDPAREIAVYAQAIWKVRVLASIAASAFSGAISVLIELKTGLYSFVLTRFLHANRFPLRLKTHFVVVWA
jgi:hypothetical protein